ncbi:MAG: nitroreductase family protein [Lactobacillales bacterium]|jgi:nitroreductase|nr:nitroreductase family protein [Lactobacillales bacterium]
MNETIQLMKKHKTIRKFDTTYEIPSTDFQAILDATRQAPTWMNGQFYSIIVIRDQAIREQLVEWSPANPHMNACSELLIFVGDLHRSKVASKMHHGEFHAKGVEPLLIATVDASLAAENTVLAVESLGLGSVVIGMIRPLADKISELLELPDYTVPLFAMSIGKPAQIREVKPRLPQKAVVHFDKYQETDEETLKEYDEILAEFAGKRQQQTWTEKFEQYFGKDFHHVTEDLLKKNGIL